MSVYKTTLEFYRVAFELLTEEGVRQVLNLMWETVQVHKLPDIVKDFVKYATTLDRLITKATNEITQDIKDMLVEEQSKITTFLLMPK